MGFQGGHLTSETSIAGTLPARNYIIGGGFNFWQRGTSFSGTLTTYTADRWFSFRQGSVTGISATQQLSGLTAGPKFCFRMQRTAGNATANALELITALESTHSIPLQGKKVTLSFWARKGADFSSAGSALTSYIATGEGTDQGVVSAWTNPQTFSQDQNITDSWVRYTLRATIPAAATQIRVDFNYVPVGTAGANDYVEIAGVMLSEGVDAPDFALAGGHEAAEQALCQRYYYRIIPGGNPLATNPDGQGFSEWIGYFNADNAFRVHGGNFPVRMRVPPVTALSSTTHLDLHKPNVFSGALNGHLTGAFTITAGTDAWSMHGVVSSAAVNFCQLYFNNAAGFITFDAEL